MYEGQLGSVCSENPVRRQLSSLSVLALRCLLAACGDNSDNHSITVVHSGGRITVVNSDIDGLSHGNIHLGNADVTVHTNDAPDAVINANGDLRIDQHPVAVDAAQRELLKS